MPLTRLRAEAARWGAACVGGGLLLAFCVAILLLQRPSQRHLQAYRGLPPAIPETAQPGQAGRRYLDLPITYTASLYQSPVDGGLVAEWPGGTQVDALGMRAFDGYTEWEFVRDPGGNEGWMTALVLAERVTALDPSPADEQYLAAVWWEGDIVFCTNPAGGPPGLAGNGFVALVEQAAARWQEVAEGRLPLVSMGRCDHDAAARGDRVSTIGWADDLGLVIAALAWPNADHGVMSEMDIQVSRGYFLRLQARDPTRTLHACVFSTLVHEMGHLLGLDHPPSRGTPSSMQAVGASRCDKAQPTASDRANLLRRYAPSTTVTP